MLIVQFVLLVLINMLLFARMGYSADLMDRQQSFVTSAGLRASRVTISGLFGIFGLTLVFSISEDYFAEKAVLAVMAVVLLMIFAFPGYFALKERYRFVGDAVFLLPLIILIFY